MIKDMFNKYFSIMSSSHGEEPRITKNDILHFNKTIYPHIPKDINSNIIEIGCGYGRYVKLLNEKGYENVFGIDISDEQIFYARHKLNLVNVDIAEPLLFLQNKIDFYDVILLIDILEHLELTYLLNLIQLIYQALKPSGVLIIQVPNAFSFIPIQYVDITHLRSFTTYTIEQVLRFGGFIKYNHYPIPIIIYGFYSFIRRMLWSCIIKPFIAFWMLIVFADFMGGIYTPNLLTTARK